VSKQIDLTGRVLGDVLQVGLGLADGAMDARLEGRVEAEGLGESSRFSVATTRPPG